MNPDCSDLSVVSAVDLKESMSQGVLSSGELISASLTRMDALDRGKRGLHAVLDRISDPSELGPLRPGTSLGGIPVLVKDNIDTARFATTAGSLALGGSHPSADAAIISALDALGACVIGKTNLSEWANMRGIQSSSGWSAVGGQCRNPYALDRSPGGSSSGSAVAVAAGYVPISIGTETDGSILCPAALNGIVGFKPTLGLIPTTGVVPVAASQDTVGVFARNTADIEMVTSAIFAHFGRQRFFGGDFHRRYLEERGRGTRFRLGIPRQGFFGYSAKADALFEAAIAEVRSAGVDVVDSIDEVTDSDFALSEADELTVLHWEMYRDLGGYLAARDVEGACSLEAVMEFNRTHAKEELAFFGQEHFEAAIRISGEMEKSYHLARAANLQRAENAIMKSITLGSVDFLCVPTMPPAWLIDHINGDSLAGAGYSVAAVAGSASISIPIGFAGGLPVGMTIFGAPYADAGLLSAASQIEAVLAQTMRPSFLDSALD